MDHIDAAEFFKIVGVATSCCSVVGSIGLFAIRSLIRANNERLMDRFNSRYLKRELYEARTEALNQKLDMIHNFQHEKHDFERDRFDEVADLCQAVKAEQEQHNVRLAVIESKLVGGKGKHND